MLFSESVAAVPVVIIPPEAYPVSVIEGTLLLGELNELRLA